MSIQEDFEFQLFQKQEYHTNPLRGDFSKHPFLVKMDEMSKKAEAHYQKTKLTRRKYVPAHIVVKYDEEFAGYGVYNTRLHIWCVGEEKEHPVFNTPEKARDWYLDQIS